MENDKGISMIADVCRRNLRKLVETYVKYTGRGEAILSMETYGNGTFIREFGARRRSISVDSYDNMLARYDDLFARSGVPWPELETIHFNREQLRQKGNISKRKPSREKAAGKIR